MSFHLFYEFAVESEVWIRYNGKTRKGKVTVIEIGHDEDGCVSTTYIVDIGDGTVRVPENEIGATPGQLAIVMGDNRNADRR